MKYLIFLLLLSSMFTSAYADVVKPALVEISVFREGHFRVEVRASIEALLTGINGQYKDTTQAPTAEEYDRLRELSAEDLGAEFAPFKGRFLSDIKLMSGEQPLISRINEVDIPVPGYTKVPRISLIVLEGEMPASAQSIQWYYPTAFGDNAVRVRQVDEANEQWHWSSWQWIREDKISEPFSLTEVFYKPSTGEVFIDYLDAGYDHIFPKGYDHILFILGLFLLSTSLSPLLWQVTMFTLAHTITLGMTIYGVIDLPARIVEPLIALSIAYVAIENLWHKSLHRSRLFIVFGFGLLHGMGFAGFLSDFGMPQDSFFTALLGFNVGVELGQLSLLLVAYLLVGFWFSQKSWYRNVVIIPFSLVIALIGLYWTWERIAI